MKRIFTALFALLCIINLQAQPFRYFKVVTLKSDNHKWQEIEWITSEGAFPNPKLTSVISNGYKTSSDPNSTESWMPYDGDIETHAWIGAVNPPQTHWITIDMGAGKEIDADSVKLTKPTFSTVNNFRVWASNDQLEWFLLLDGNGLMTDQRTKSFPLSIIEDTEAPTTPGTPVLLSRTTEKLNIFWDASVDDRELVSYEIFINGVFSVSSETNSFLLTDLEEATDYDIHIVAVDPSGNRSEESETVIFTTKSIDITQPSAPGTPVLHMAGSDILTFKWEKATDNDEIAGYLVYLDGVIAGITEDSIFSIPGLDASKAFSISIKAKDISGNISESASATLNTTEAGESKMIIGTNFWNLGWGGSGNDPFKTGFQNVSGDNPWKPEFLDDVSIYSHYRFMDWLETNNSALNHWRNRTQKSKFSQNPMAFEWMIDLCNIQNKDIWITVPHRVVSATGMEAGTNHFVKKLAILLKTGVDMQDLDLDAPEYANINELTATELMALGGLKTCKPLKSGLKIYIEYSNETWNFGFQQAEYCRVEGIKLGFSGDEYTRSRKFHAWAAIRMFTAMEEVFGKDNPRLMKIDAYQVVSVNQISEHLEIYKSTEYNPGGIYPDAFSPAPYIGHSVNGSSPTMKKSMITDINDVTLNVKSARRTLDNATKAGSPAFDLIAYEGGQHILQNAHIASRNPEMYEIYVQYLDSMSNYLDELSHYLHSGTFATGGAWGSKESIVQDISSAHKFRAIVEWVEGTATRPDSQRPNAPEGLEASNVTETGFTLSWLEGVDNHKVTSYNIYLNSEFNVSVDDVEYDFENLKPGRLYDITVYSVDSTGNISLQGNTIQVLTSGTASFTVSFVIKSGSDFLEGVLVDFNGQESITDTNGKAEFSSQPAGSSIPWNVSFAGYLSQSGSVDLLSIDPVFNLNLSSTIGIESSEAGVKMWPNPAADFILFEAFSGLKSFNINDLSGRPVMKGDLFGNNESLDISSLPGGIYIVTIINQNDGLFRQKMVKY